MKHHPCLSLALAAIVLALSADPAPGQVARQKDTHEAVASRQ